MRHLPIRIGELIQQLVIEGKAKIEHAARSAGIGQRTLQRRLAETGMTYSGLVDQMRLVRAISLIEEPSNKLGDVARQLGYSDPANFTRAFRRWTGLSPSKFRKLDRKSRNIQEIARSKSIF